MFSALAAAPHPDARLRELLGEYRELLEMPNKQGRGQRFNQFLADLFEAWGIEAHANQQGLRRRDEIDVAVAAGHGFYILEAKWEAKKIKLDPVAKLEMRLRVRPPGTGGIIVSMSGFTHYVYEYTEYHPEILLLDRSHIEAMLAGLLDPKRIFHDLVFLASRRGGSSATLKDLLTPPRVPALPLWEAAGADAAARVPSITYQAAEVSIKPLISQPDGSHHAWNAMTLDRDGKHLLGSTPEGINRLDPNTGQSQWISTVPCSGGAALPEPGGGIAAQANWAVARHAQDELVAIAGAFPLAGSHLLADPTGQLYVLASSGGRHTLTKLGATVGTERGFSIAFAGQVLHGAVLPGERFYLASTLRCGVLDIGENMTLTESNWFDGPLVEAGAVVGVGENTVLTAGRSKDSGIHVAVYATNLDTLAHTKLLELESPRVTSLIKGKNGVFYILLETFNAASHERAVLLEITVPASLLP